MRSDWFGLILSAACLLHCLMLPVALVAAPALAAWLGETETTLHWLLFGVALGVSGWALLAGYRRHGVLLVVTAGSAGLAVMAVAAAHLFGASMEATLTLVGAAIVAFAHVINLRLCGAAAGAGACHEHG